MSKKNRVNLANTIYNFQRKITSNKPPLHKMYEEIRMMKFKVKPLQGNISDLNFKNQDFIEVLWNLGKLDEFFRKEHKNLDKKQREVFHNFFDNLYDKFQTRLNEIELRGETEDEKNAVIEMEIYKEDLLRKKHS